jgi:predicted PurR-regulated permease PerM
MRPEKPKLVGGSQPERPSSAEQAVGNAAEPALGLAPKPWMEKRKFSYVALLILTGGALYVAYIIFRPFLTSLFLALVLTIAVLPLHEWISRRVRGPTAAALITTATVLLLILVPLILMSLKLVAEAASLYNFLFQKWSAAPWSGHFAWLSEAVQRVAERTGMPPEQLKAGITARVQEFAASLVGVIGWAARGVGQQITTAILTLLVLFFFLRDREKYTRGLARLLPLPPGRMQQLSATLHESVIANVYGMLAVGLIQGTLTAIGFWITGLRSPLLWGAVATISSFVPLIGPSLVWIPGALVLAVQGNWARAMVLAAWGAVVVSSGDYIVRPRIAGGRDNANTLLVLLSLLGGIAGLRRHRNHRRAGGASRSHRAPEHGSRGERNRMWTRESFRRSFTEFASRR